MSKKLFRAAAILLISALSVSMFACDRSEKESVTPRSELLSNEQISTLEWYAGAFAEYGSDYGADNPMLISNIETFVYYLYNDFMPSSGSYYSVASDESDAVLDALFGTHSTMRTRVTAGKDYYYADGFYYIIPSPQRITAGFIEGSDAQLDDGSIRLSFSVTRDEEKVFNILLTVEITDGGLSVLSSRIHNFS